MFLLMLRLLAFIFHLGAILGHLGAILGPSWAILGHPGGLKVENLHGRSFKNCDFAWEVLQNCNMAMLTPLTYHILLRVSRLRKLCNRSATGGYAKHH